VQILLRPIRLVLVALIALLLSSAPALAAKCPKAPRAPKSKSCAKAIVGDWYSDGDLDYIYPLDCYTNAIKSLGADLRGYSNAPDDIGRARRFAKRGCGDPGRVSAVTPTPTETTPTDSLPTQPDQTDTATVGGSGGSSSVPVPLIVLGGLAVLLVAAGGAGYLSRRRRAAEGPGDDPPRKQLPR
jgi:hypothetical protein